MTIFISSEAPLSVTVLILPDSSMMSVACTLDPMRAANRVARKPVFNWQIQTLDGEPAMLTCGIPVAAQSVFGEGSTGDVLIIIAGFDQQIYAAKPMVTKLAKLSRGFRSVGGVEAGSWLLARAGLLDDHQATTHWEDLEIFAEKFPKIDVVPDRFVIDRRYFTTGGASPTFDLMLHLIRVRLGVSISMQVASVFIYDEAHRSSDAQPLMSLGRLSRTEPQVAKAIRIMEEHIDEPISIAMIASILKVSTRTLEALFARSLQYSPGQYYRQLRLQFATRLMLETGFSLQEIAVRAGFNSLTAFSRSFKSHYKLSPGKWRRASARNANWTVSNKISG